MIKNKKAEIINVKILELLIIIGIGSNKAISTSKIKKITAIRKNRRENGNRAEAHGSNPHSKGDLFSRSTIVFFDNKDARDIMMIVIIRVKVDKNKIFIITYFKWLIFLIGSQMYNNILNK